MIPHHSKPTTTIPIHVAGLETELTTARETAWPIIIVTGSRRRRDKLTVWRTLDALADPHGGLRIVVGDCPRGIDIYVRLWCGRNRHRCQWRVYEADWDRYGLAAGPKRNQAMVHANRDALVCLAFPLPGPRSLSKGTWNCADTAAAAGIPVEVIDLEAA